MILTIPEFLTALGVSSSLLLAFLAYITKRIIEHWLNKEIDRFKDTLRNDSDRKMSEFQSHLEKERIRLQISYGGIFEKQADAIIEIYRLTTDLEDCINETLYELPSENSDADRQFIEKWQTLKNRLKRDRILLPERIDDMFHDLESKVFISVREYKNAEKHLQKNNITQETQLSMLGRQDRAHAELDKVKEIKEELIITIRKTIGIFSPDAQ